MMTKKVLIIEDNPDIAECLRVGLERAQFTVKVALTGEEGLHASLDRNDPPSAILLDVRLPGMSGIELCRRLRQEPNTRHTPIIIVTATTIETDSAAASVGADCYITKPFSVHEVVERVHSFLQTPDITPLTRTEQN
jgi:two-component system phosphate regulon response regulator PhoB